MAILLCIQALPAASELKAQSPALSRAMAKVCQAVHSSLDASRWLWKYMIAGQRWSEWMYSTIAQGELAAHGMHELVAQAANLH